MFERVRLAKAIAHFAREHLRAYGPLLQRDLHQFRDEIVTATLGAGISLAAGLIFCAFLSVAVIVSAWAGPHRVLIAWLVCVSWGVIAGAGLLIARRVLMGPVPFHLMSGALSRDYAALLRLYGSATAGSHEPPAPHS